VSSDTDTILSAVPPNEDSQNPPSRTSTRKRETSPLTVDLHETIEESSTDPETRVTEGVDPLMNRRTAQACMPHCARPTLTTGVRHVPFMGGSRTSSTRR
jgi:hypothetical protein